MIKITDEMKLKAKEERKLEKDFWDHHSLIPKDVAKLGPISDAIKNFKT